MLHPLTLANGPLTFICHTQPFGARTTTNNYFLFSLISCLLFLNQYIIWSMKGKKKNWKMPIIISGKRRMSSSNCFFSVQNQKTFVHFHIRQRMATNALIWEAGFLKMLGNSAWKWQMINRLSHSYRFIFSNNWSDNLLFQLYVGLDSKCHMMS